MNDELDAARKMGELAALGGTGGILSYFSTSAEWSIKGCFARAASSAALGMAAFAVLIVKPDAEPIALAGLSTFLGVLGTSGIFKIVSLRFGRSPH